MKRSTNKSIAYKTSLSRREAIVAPKNGMKRKVEEVINSENSKEVINSDKEERDEESDVEQEEDEGEEENSEYDSEEGSGSDSTSRDCEKGLRPADKIAVGLDLQQLTSLEKLQAIMVDSQLNFVCLPIFSGGEVIDELLLDNGDMTSFIVGKVSDLSAFTSLSSTLESYNDTLYDQYSYSAHLGLQAVLLPLADIQHCPSALVSRVLTNTLQKFPPTAPQIWLQIKPCMYAYWNHLRHLLDHNVRIFLALDLTAESIEALTALQLDKWKAEPVKAVFLSTHKHFDKAMIDAEGLKRVCQFFFQFPIHFILQQPVLQPPAATLLHNNSSSHPKKSGRKAKKARQEEQSSSNMLGTNSNQATDTLAPIVSAIHTLRDDWLHTPFSSTPAEAEALQLEAEFNFSFRDTLQTPLDPLQVSLDLETYRVMEEDPVKYAKYEEALISAMNAIRTKRLQLKPNNADKAANNNSVVRVLVVGPGRGALIESSLLAGAVTRQEVQVIAIEKNNNAIRTLRRRFKTRSSQVTLLHGDMRQIVPLHQLNLLANGTIDIIVSELLGSFADNEASPECLHAIELVLNRETGVMIPHRYTSFLQPISSAKVWQQARTMLNSGGLGGERSGLDHPYVVHLHAIQSHGQAAQPAFQFIHPSSPTIGISSISHMDSQILQLGNQAVRLHFKIAEDTTIHGFAGYFECTLHGTIGFSTLPTAQQLATQDNVASPGMFSWFPMFFPLARPLLVRAGQSLDVMMWRCVSLREGPKQMWYEWQVTSPIPLPLQNSLGKSFYIQL